VVEKSRKKIGEIKIKLFLFIKLKKSKNELIGERVLYRIRIERDIYGIRIERTHYRNAFATI